MPPRDESTLTFETGKKELSQRKLEQLAKAREKAMLSRRKALKAKLELKLSELRHVLGSDMSNPTVERVAEAIMKQEKELRNKQNALTEKLSEAMDGFKDELRALRGAMAKSSVSLSQVKGSKPRPHGGSEVSTSVSRQL